MINDSRLKDVVQQLDNLKQRAQSLAQVSNEQSMPVAARVDAVLALTNLRHALLIINEHNSIIMGHLSKNEKLAQLQKENAELKKALAKQQGKSEAETESTDNLVAMLEGNVGEVKDAVADMDDVELLKSLLKSEQDGDDRKGAKKAIAARIEEIEDAEAE